MIEYKKTFIVDVDIPKHESESDKDYEARIKKLVSDEFKKKGILQAYD